MKKYILFTFALGLFSFSFMNAQFLHTDWKFSAKKVNDCEYDLIFTVSIDKGYHIAAAAKIKGAEGMVKPTEINFKPNKDYALVGALIESKPVSEFDKTIDMNVLQHYNKAVFIQRVKLNSSANTKISGTYEYQLCDNTKCEYPPKDPFSFDLQGTPGCSK